MAKDLEIKHNWIVQEMLETLPPPDGSMGEPREIVDIAFAEDGTVRTYLKGEKYPTRFYTPVEVVNAVASYKRLLSELLQNVWGWIFIVFGKKMLERWLFRHLELFPVRCKEQHWSEPVKELRRVLNIKPIWKDVISLVFQHDMAYCYRFQDIMGELNKESFEKNSVKETERILRIAINRDTGSPIMQKFKKLLPYAMFVFRFVPKAKIKAVVRDIDLNHIKLSKEDIYWTNIVDNYDYRGLPYKTRLEEYIKEKNNQI
jgi:hypothetical protein